MAYVSDSLVAPTKYREVEPKTRGGRPELHRTYRVGDDGSTWSRSIAKGGDWNKLKPRTKKSGHAYVNLGKGTENERSVHRMVLEAFVGPCPEGMEACHGDGNASNNSLSNLRWDTHKSNMDDRNRHGTSNRGQRHGMAKLSADDVIAVVGRLRSGETQKSIADAFGVSQPTISDIETGRRWASLTQVGTT